MLNQLVIYRILFNHRNTIMPPRMEQIANGIAIVVMTTLTASIIMRIHDECS